MLLRRVTAPFLQAHCYILAAAGARSALVVDPGAGAAPGVRAVLAQHGLDVGAVFLTHGHPDHVWDAAQIAGAAPVYIAEPDLYRLDGPAAVRRSHDPDVSAMLPTPWQRPQNVRVLPAQVLTGGGADLLEGLTMRVVPAPGHTEGSTLTLLGEVPVELGEHPEGDAYSDTSDIRTAIAGVLGRRSPADPGTPEPVALALAGDVIFFDSIGRTDLQGGDPEVMAWTLRTLAQVIHPATVLLPGHGPATWWARELTMNGYVRQALIDS